MLYRLLLRAFPPAFRARFGDDMAALFRDRLRRARARGPLAVAFLWGCTVIDLFAHGAAERRAARHIAGARTRSRISTMWHSLLQDVRYAVRTLRQRPGATTAALLTLALGIGANTAIFSVVHAVLLRDLPYPEADRITRIYATHRRYNFSRGVVNPFDFDYLERHARTFSRVAVMDFSTATLTGAGEPMALRGQNVMPAFFDIVGVRPAQGRVFTAEEARAKSDTVVISHGLWRSAFGGRADIVGLPLMLDDQPGTVIGVMPEGFALPEGMDFWRPYDLTPAERRQMGSWSLDVIAQLGPGITVAAAQQEVDRIGRDLEAAFPKQRRDRGFNIVTLRDDLAFRSRDGLRLLQGVVLFVLLIACANVANLLLAQTVSRQREFGLRAAVGASRLRLIRQSLTESVVLACTGAVLGVLLAFWGVRALVAMAPALLLPDPDSIGISWPVLGMATLAALVTGLVFGLAPALASSATDLSGALKHGMRTTAGGLGWSRRQWLRAALVTAEIALALVLVAGAGLLVRSFAVLMRQAPGFETDHLLTAQVTLPDQRYATTESRLQFWRDLTDRLGRIPGVTGAAGSTAVPFSNWEWQSDFRIKGREQVPNDGAGTRSVTPSYFTTMGIPLQRGRAFSADDSSSSPSVAIVSDAFVREHMAGLDPIGQQVTFNSPKPQWSTIVGVVGATRHHGLDEALRPEIYRPITQQEGIISTTLLFAVRTATEPGAFAPLLRSAVHGLDPNLPVQEVRTMEELIGLRLAERRFYMTLLTMFAALAAVLAIVGVYSVMAYVVSQGRREIGIRLALGARPAQVRTGVLIQGLRVIGAGAAIGLAGALSLSGVLKKQLFATEPNDPMTLAIAAVTLVSIAIAACWVPALRTSRVDPVGALRAE